MAEEISEAVQIIRVTFEGVELVMKMGGGGLSAMKKAASFVSGMLNYEKSMGKTSMKKLLLKGGDLQVMQFPTSAQKDVMKWAKKYGILYSVLPTMKGEGDMVEMIFHQEAIPRANILLQKLNCGRLMSFNDYLMNGDEKHLQKMMDFFQSQKQPGNASVNNQLDNLIEKVGLFATQKEQISIESVKENFSVPHATAESVLDQLQRIGLLSKRDKQGMHKVIMDREAFLNRLQGYHELADRMRMMSVAQNSDISDVTISKKLIKDENDHAIKTRVPGTWGENARYVWLKKENVMEIHSGKTLLAFLDSEKDYKLYDDNNRVVETKRGSELYSKHYDPVDSEVRRRYEKAQKNAAEQARRQQPPRR